MTRHPPGSAPVLIHVHTCIHSHLICVPPEASGVIPEKTEALAQAVAFLLVNGVSRFQFDSGLAAVLALAGSYL